MITPVVVSVGEPSDAAWRRFGDLAAAALARLAERDALAADAEAGVLAS